MLDRDRIALEAITHRRNSVTDTPVPEMTDAHVRIFERMTLDYTMYVDYTSKESHAMGDIGLLLRSIREGSVVVVVKREELDAVRESLAVAETQVGHPTFRLAHKSIMQIDRWLSRSDTTDATTQETR